MVMVGVTVEAMATVTISTKTPTRGGVPLGKPSRA